ncbi:uncharacterized protein CANTADRAFT_36397, partial [Suhomyces tanzawaensis NRRL Y-17324]
ASVHAADSLDVALLTAFVSDFRQHPQQYIGFFATANNVPSGITDLAKTVITYTDLGYTTLLDNSAVNVNNLRSFAEQLPWYTRLASDSDVPASTSGTASVATSGSTTAAASRSGSSASAGRLGSSSSTRASVGSSSAQSSSSNGGVAFIAPAGAVLGAVAVALL